MFLELNSTARLLPQEKEITEQWDPPGGKCFIFPHLEDILIKEETVWDYDKRILMKQKSASAVTDTHTRCYWWE